jgi:hypothetical protein
MSGNDRTPTVESLRLQAEAQWAEATKEGRSYLVDAPDFATAISLARTKAGQEGHPNAGNARLLHWEKVNDGQYEVVFAVQQR